MAQEQTYREIIKLLLLTLNKISLYSASHPVVKESIGELYNLFKDVLTKEKNVTIALGLNQLIVNGTVLEEKFLGVKELFSRLRELKIDSFSVEKQVNPDELFIFIASLSKKKEALQAQGISKEEVLKNGLEHIKINRVHYEQVGEDEKVVSALRQATEVAPTQTIEKEKEPTSVFKHIEDLLSGQVREIQIDKELILNQLDKNPALVARLILEVSQKSGTLTDVVSRFCQWLLEQALTDLLKKRKDPAKLLSNLEKEMNRQSDASLFSEKIKSEVNSIPAVLSEYSDNLKVEMLAGSYTGKKQDLDKLIRLTAKFLTTSKDRSRIISRLEPRLKEKGITSQEYSQILKGITEEGGEKVTISQREYEELLKKSKEFETQLEEKIELATGEFKKINKQLIDEKERVDTVIRNLAEGLVVVDKNGKVLMMNPAAEKLLSVENKQQLGKPLVEGIKKEHLVALTKGPLYDKEGRATKEIELISQDESTKRVLRASSAVVEDQDGKTVGMVSVLSDITREKELEKMKSNFVSHVSHELRTPIIAMQKSLSLILSKSTGEINPDQEKFLKITNSNLERLFRLINDILDISKLEAHKLELNISAFNLNEVVQEVVSSLYNWAKEKGINLESKLTAAEIIVHADKDRIIQVITNLLGNAIKFTPQGGKISAEVISLAKAEGIYPGECIQVDVSDTGIGIEQKDLGRIFNKFEQVSLVQPSGIAGTGLGLAICKEIIELHKGKIWAQGQIGEGSKFSFIIPKEIQIKT